MEARIIDLGTLRTGIISFGNGISSNGDVVVGSSTTTGVTSSRAFRWQNGTMVELTGLDTNAISTAQSVNADGTVIAGSTSVGGVFRAWIFDGTTYTSLGNLGTTSGYSQVRDMSAYGNIVTGDSRLANGILTAFRWQNGTMISIGTLPPPYTSSNSLGIDPTGTYIVGYASGGAQANQAYIWSSAGGMVGLGYPFLVLPFSRAYSISTTGVVVGIASFSNSELGSAFSYKNGVYTNLGRLPGYTFSLAYDISADGTVITGYSYNTATGLPLSNPTTSAGFRYTNGIMTNIGDLGTYRTASDMNTMTLTGRVAGDDDPTLSIFALTISADGNAIAGTSEVRMLNGSIEQHAFLYKFVRIRNVYYDDNQKFVAQAKDNQKKFSDSSSYTQFLKARASGNMYRYQG